MSSNTEALKPSNSGGLDDLVMLELRDVARKAQVDYVAVNHPDGIRHGEDPELLGEFLKVNHERILKAVKARDSTLKAEYEEKVRQAGLEELRYLLQLDDLAGLPVFQGDRRVVIERRIAELNTPKKETEQ